MGPLALAPAEFSGNGKGQPSPTKVPEKDEVKAIRNEIQQIHQSQNSQAKKKGLGDFKPYENTNSSNDIKSFEMSELQYASLDDSLPIKEDVKRSSHDELLHKLDQILFLLEEQRDHKTGHVAEDVVLYSFIGIFIIFVLDSFARAGKYVR